jgi:hypothetical protein
LNENRKPLAEQKQSIINYPLSIINYSLPMRFLVREQSYEQRVAGGVLRYERDNRPIPTRETWRITRAPGGHTIWRTDLDARQGESGDSLLWHLVRHADGSPERLLWRTLDRQGAELKGDVLWEGDRALHHRISAGERQEWPWSADSVLLLPSCLGLALLTRTPGTHPALWLVSADLHPVTLTVQAESADATGQWYRITWHDQVRRICVTPHHCPLAMQRPDGLHARTTQLLTPLT